MPAISSRSIAISILLPTYNEHDNLPLIVYLIGKELSSARQISEFEIIVVDDGSPDGTGTVADRLASPHTNGGLLREGQMKVLKRPGKQGLGSAYVHGCTVARHPYIAILDADLSHHPRHLVTMVDRMLNDSENVDIVCGSRYVAGGGVWGWDLRRRLVSRGANFLADFLLDPQVSDLTGSFRLYKKEVFMRLVKEAATKGYTFQMEIMVRARKHGMRIVEVPITFVDRLYGESKLGAGEIVGYLGGLWTLFTTA